MFRLPFRPRHWLAGLVLLAALPAAAAPPPDVELPPVDEVFVLSAQATARDRIEVRWQIADGYYLYRHRTSVTADAGFPGASLALPEGAKHHDEFFGDVQTYRKRLRSEEHTSELQSRENLVCRLLLERKKLETR